MSPTFDTMTARLPSSLTESLLRNSPRFSRPATPWQTIAVHGSVLLLWALLLWAAFHQHSALAWSVGVVYAVYDTALLLFVAWQTRDLRRAMAPAPADGTPIAPGTQASLGVIVAAHNETAVLPVTLQALLDQTDRPDQITIADDGSSDGTAELLARQYGLVAPPLGCLSAESATHPGLFWLRLPHGGKARALTRATPKHGLDLDCTAGFRDAHAQALGQLGLVFMHIDAVGGELCFQGKFAGAVHPLVQFAL